VTLISIVPFCLTLGYLTPRLIDAYCQGNPASAGRVYGVNIAGGVLGPLFAAYILLPMIGTRAALVVLSAPLVLLFMRAAALARRRPQHKFKIVTAYAALFVFSLMVSRGVEDGEFYQDPHEIRRDQVATVAADGSGMGKRLLVNGYGVTTLTPITKVMAHLPLAMNGHANSGLVICFGMGTTFRAMHAWGIDTTAVDLSRSVIESFGFFFADAQDVVRDPKVHLVVDDGRRYLLRVNRSFDVIAIDPPPPIEAAASSLLYSVEFYEVVKKRLAPGGILQQWFPGGDDKAQEAVERSLREAFPYVVAFKSIGPWGYHYLASTSPIRDMTSAEFVAALPQAARRDLMEWNPELTIERMAQHILSGRASIESLLSRDGTGMVTDDRPYNEYYFLRRHRIW
jgi:predicted membrane-bound spermidine synthase